MRELGAKRTLLDAFFIAIFFSLINTPFYFDPNQINNQAFLSLRVLNIPLQIFPVFGVFFYFLGFRNRFIVFSTLITLLIFLLHSLPEMPNHRYVILIVACYLCSDLLSKNSEDPWNRLGVFSQLLLSIIYLYAFLAKLNTAYLNPEISCATVFYENVKLSSLSFLPTNKMAHIFAIYSSLIFEGLAFIFILNKRYRLLVVFAGLLFHLGLSLDLVKYFTNFSSIMYFLLFSSLGSSAYMELEVALGRLNSNFLIRKLFRWSLFIILILCLLSGLENFTFKTNAFNALILTRHLLWLTVAFFTIYIILKQASSYTTKKPEGFVLKLVPTVLLILLILNCLGPYLGYKTRSALTMYSNLRMEENYSNHLLFSKSMDSLSFFSNTAQVLRSENTCPTKLKTDLTYPLFEIARVDRECPGEISKIRYNNEGIEYEDLKWNEIMTLFKYPILSKLLVFGPVGDGAERECVW